MEFEQWLALSPRIPKEQWTFKQYGNYLQGWRDSMPLAYRGMSVAYDNWAEKKWGNVQDKTALIQAWKQGQALLAYSLQHKFDKVWAKSSVEEAADFMLSVFVPLSGAEHG